MARVLFSLTDAQIRALEAVDAGELDPYKHDSRTLEELRRRDWISYKGYSRYSSASFKLRTKGAAVLRMSRALELEKIPPMPPAGRPAAAAGRR